ncbi:hypothetical protein WOC09_24140 [Vibrio parahaemolyticus]|uniref:hypothetical protein n=1 Tax=Vibrio parahaemolyticus TaxID=670 RepID=UPI00041F4891|nr:hypothetical protein [Vibrio parahaemolyticus]ELB2172768.1 hypothetical protein [Vibrio parahaemolyticus]MDF4907282.1 hypothetical protein [Vibrio parahaemolyticus]HAS6495920.1 hypothetical protein [Vibrio parahaemolyticus]HAS6511212.1 hypothetical protein [Vibrio parahaemolyticus]HAS6516197.1 hypothetical protein [Vibrio parahaemolyticus]
MKPLGTQYAAENELSTPKRSFRKTMPPSELSTNKSASETAKPNQEEVRSKVLTTSET